MPQSGAPQDFASLYDLYFSRVCGFVRSQVGDPASREPGPDERLAASQENERLLRALAGLDSRSREVLGLKFQAGLNNRQIAEVLDLGESHVGVLVYRAVKKLQAELGEPS